MCICDSLLWNKKRFFFLCIHYIFLVLSTETEIKRLPFDLKRFYMPLSHFIFSILCSLFGDKNWELVTLKYAALPWRSLYVLEHFTALSLLRRLNKTSLKTSSSIRCQQDKRIDCFSSLFFLKIQILY